MLLRTQGPAGVFVGAHAVSEGWLTRRQLADGPCSRVLQGADLLHEADLGVLLRERTGRRWSRRVRAAFELVDRRSASPPESWVRVALALAGLPAPVLQYEVVHEGAWLAAHDLRSMDAVVARIRAALDDA